ncbi:unnamed protein product, partial [Enterobius vermicularis]|uniref:Neur_chan_LBD domain-containing protein n=1 Tax=Enterobius vermicularis TaxID=51028 RepID=A0A0N4VG91_ENTVE
EETRILQEKFNANYDPTIPWNKPALVHTALFINHIEKLDEKQGLMKWHGTLNLVWEDKRLVWDTKAYNITKIVRSKGDLPKLWYPNQLFSDRKEQLINNRNTVFSLKCINNTAFLTAQVKISLKTTCKFNFVDYPNDSQVCSLSLHGSESVETVMLVDALSEHNENGMYGIALKNENRIQTGDFVVSNLTATHLLNGISSQQNTEVSGGDYLVLHFEITFRRQLPQFNLTVALPVTYLIAAFTNLQQCIFWLLLCGFIQGVNFDQMIKILPPDPPFCAKLAALIFSETFVLIFLRILLTYSQQESLTIYLRTNYTNEELFDTSEHIWSQAYFKHICNRQLCVEQRMEYYPFAVLFKQLDHYISEPALRDEILSSICRSDLLSSSFIKTEINKNRIDNSSTLSKISTKNGSGTRKPIIPNTQVCMIVS